ncbi:MAG: hypothetical protein JWM05_1959, partial [Acidimicrobiales bacterium]|nr:hypothetical protein [Acidimicrobiales bacterium]
LAPVCDPACGGGAFLLAAADALLAAGVDPGEAVRRWLWGTDLDPVAVAAADAALACWAWAAGDRSSARAGPHLVAADALLGDRPWPEPPADGFGLVVGNPPFQGQLGRETARSPATTLALRERWGDVVGPYTDAAALFLVAAVRAVRPGGRVALILPSSTLSARDAAAARAAAVADADLVGLWVGAEPVFAAAVRVCAPILARRPLAGPATGVASASGHQSDRSGSGTSGRPVVARWRGVAFERLPSAAMPSEGDGWGGLALAAHGVPVVVLRTGGRLGDLASATAGFRDQFYGLVPYVREAPGDGGPDELEDGLAPLVTTGLVDLAGCAWGRRTCRFAGRVWRRPAVDLPALRRGEPGVARWVDDRLVPKVVVASQTRVGEAAVDARGRWVPSVPLVAVVAAPERLWDVAALVASPPIAALAMARSAGAALSDGALKLSARQILDLPLPADEGAWQRGTAALQAGDLDRFGEQMTLAYGLAADDPVVTWWRSRLPAAAGRLRPATSRPPAAG